MVAMIPQPLRDAFDAVSGWIAGVNAMLNPYTSAYFQRLHDLLPEPFFHTRAFLAFFALVFVLYWSIPRKWQLTRIWLLVIASFHFYAAWSKDLAFLVTTTTVADYLFGRLMDASQRRPLRRAVLLSSIGMNLGILCYFKYRGFFLNELHAALTRYGYDPGYGRLDLAAVIVPFGISFYTFEAISYAVDVYRRKIPAERSLPRFLCFILFFPHLVSGPIVRAGDFLTQTRRPKRWNWVRVQVGVQLLLMGAFKKMAIADRMAVFCDPIFKDPGAYNSGAVWLAVLAYAIRIYCDFSGYSDMALGTAHLFGYRLTNNFAMPYFAPNVTEFWRRWHISLSTWLRDYVFIPLGGSRGGRWHTYRNLMITMTLGGLWHGAAWSFVLWGVAHGLLLVIHKQFKDWVTDRPRLDAVLQTQFGTALRVLVTFLCVSLCWVLFQPNTPPKVDPKHWENGISGLEKALVMYERLFSVQMGQPLPLHNRSLWYTVAFVLVCHLLVTRGIWQRVHARLPAPVLGFGYALCLCLALVLTPDGSSFIYFDF
jgi:D-alanyl-lipoteichoic acid acyltransferase DltB (MBOAT superfamily)